MHTAKASDNFLPPQERSRNWRSDTKKLRITKTLETAIEFFTASSPTGLLSIKPAGLMLYYTGAHKLAVQRVTYWCEREDSNPHPLRDQILSLDRPIDPQENQQLTAAKSGKICNPGSCDRQPSRAVEHDTN